MILRAVQTRNSPFWGELRSGITRATTITLDEIAARTEGRPEAALQARTTLGTYLAGHTRPGLLVTDVARALAIAEPDGLTASDLYHIAGHRGRVVPILERYPAFVPDNDGRWHLGRPARLPEVTP